MKPFYIIFILVFLSKVAQCQEREKIRLQNHLGFKIVNIDQKFAITDNIGNYAVRDTFDSISLESARSYGKNRNSFVCKKGNNFYLISSDCQSISKFDSIEILKGAFYLCVDKNRYLLMNDEYQILHDSLSFIAPLQQIPDEFIYKKNDICGILNAEDLLIELKVDSLIDIYSWKYIGIVSNGKMGIFDYEKEKILLKPNFDYIVESHIHSEKEKQRFLIFNNGKFNLINKQGRILSAYDFDKVTTWVENGPEGHYISVNDKIGLVDYNGKEIIPPIYHDLFYCSSGIYKAVKGNKFGVLNSKNKLIVPFEYNSIIVDDFRLGSNEEMFIYALDGQVWKKIDYTGNIINENCNECDFIKNLAPFQINHYGFEYVRDLMISKDNIKI